MSALKPKLPLAACAAFSALVAAEGTARADEAWFDLSPAYPLVIDDGSSVSDYAGVIKVGAHLGVSTSTEKKPAFAFGLGLDHWALTNKVRPSANVLPGRNQLATAAATALTTYWGVGVSSTRLVWCLYGGAGVAWRSFEGVGGLAPAWHFSVETLGWFVFDSDTEKHFAIGPDVELSVLTEGLNSNIGFVSMSSFGLRLGLVVK